MTVGWRLGDPTISIFSGSWQWSNDCHQPIVSSLGSETMAISDNDRFQWQQTSGYETRSFCQNPLTIHEFQSSLPGEVIADSKNG